MTLDLYPAAIETKSCTHKSNMSSLQEARCKNGLDVSRVKKVETVLTSNLDSCQIPQGADLTCLVETLH